MILISNTHPHRRPDWHPSIFGVLHAFTARCCAQRDIATQRSRAMVASCCFSARLSSFL